MFQMLACGGCNHQLHPHDVDYVDDFTGESFCHECMVGGIAHHAVTSTPVQSVMSVPKRSVADIVFGVGGGSILTPTREAKSEIDIY